MKNNEEELELITSVKRVNPEALEELSNGLDEADDVEECLALARQHTEIVGANAANNFIFSPLCNVIIPTPNYNPRSDAYKYGVTNNKIDTITIHHMAGNLTVETCGNMFARPSRQASSNYGIGTDGRIGGYCGEENRSWCSGSRVNDFRAITIEVANNTLSPTWTVSELALQSLYNLLVDICKRNGIQRLIWSENKNDRVNHVNGCNVTYHCDYGKTACPGPYFKKIMSNVVTVVNNLLSGEPAPQPTPIPTTNPYKKPTSTVYSGSNGESVKWIQWQLNTYGYGLAVDGSYGPATTSAVRDFQSKKGLSVTGNCDINTINVLDGAEPQPNPAPTPSLPAGTPDPYADYSKATWDFFRILGMNEFGCAGIVGNISMESAIRPNNLQNSFEKKFGLNDDQYTAKVDNGTYTNFVNDGAGYGLAQWTYSTRKKGLLDLAKQCKMSICDINLQLTYLTQELQIKYKGVWDNLMKATSVLEASNIMLLQFEKPADQSVANQQKRAACCQGYYDKFKGSAVTTVFPIPGITVMGATKKEEERPVKTTAMLLNVRSGPGINYSIKTSLRKNSRVLISEIENDWGKLANGSGWINMKFTKLDT